MFFKKTADKILFSSSQIFEQFWDSHPYVWIKLGVVLMVFVASVIFGYKASPKWTLLALVLIGGGIGFITLLRYPEIGVLVLIPLSFFTTWEMGTGTSASFNLTFIFILMIIGIWIFRVFTNRGPEIPQRSSINILSIMFISATFISFLGGNIKWVLNAQDQATLPAQIGGWLLYILSIGIMLYIQAHIKDIRWLKILTWLFICLGSIYIIEAFSPIKFISKLHFFSTGSVGSMYWVWLIALSFGQFMFNKKLHYLIRLALGLLIIAILAFGLSPSHREWTSGWLPPLIAMATILWLRSWRIGLAATIVAIVIIIISKSSFFTDVVVSTNQYSILSRYATYPILFELIKTNPIIGLGFANYSHYTYLYPILGWYVSFNSHNNYMDIIAQTGFVGMVLFICLMIAVGLRGWKLRKLEVDGFSSGYINGCIGGLVGMLAAGMLGDWFLPYLYNIGIPGFRASVFAWIFLGGLLALGRILHIQENQPPSLGMQNQSE